jgi:uncharacterized NAD-dependent epimerase/dehydratase family protein
MTTLFEQIPSLARAFGITSDSAVDDIAHTRPQAAVVLAEGVFATARAKVAHGLVRGTSRYDIRAVVDSSCAGADAGVLLDGRPIGIPVIADLADAQIPTGPGRPAAIVGVAPHGGRLTPELHAQLVLALEFGFDLVCGLHDFLCNDPVIAPLAERLGATLTDVRKPPTDRALRFWTGDVTDVRATRIAVLGTDCMVGKRTTARLLVEGLRDVGTSAEMIYTGQTGWMQGGRYGIVLDSMTNDFIPGELEGAMLRCAAEVDPDVMVLEGQSGMRNPSGGGGGAVLMLSGDVHAVVLQHSPAREFFDGLEDRGHRIPDLADEVALLERFGRPVCAITLNTQGMEPAEIGAECTRLEEQLGIPVVAPLRHGVGRVIEAVRRVTSLRK